MSSTRFHKICFLDPAVSVNVSDICLLRSGDGWDAARVAVDPQFEPSATGGEIAREREGKGGAFLSSYWSQTRGMYWHQQAADPPQIIKSEV